MTVIFPEFTRTAILAQRVNYHFFKKSAHDYCVEKLYIQEMPNALAIEIRAVKLRIHAEREKSVECVVTDTLTNSLVIPMWQMIKP